MYVHHHHQLGCIQSGIGIAHVSQLATGCVTCHTCHGCMMDFRPILGNPVEVTHMTSPGTVYISHAKGTYFPLARMSWYDLPSFLSHLCLCPTPSLSPSNSI